jgi:hypothetical protein
VYYRQTIFLPAWAELDHRTRLWTTDNQEIANEALAAGRVLVVWFHDECTFYANNRWIVCWVHESEKAVPWTKGEGVSLMVADFISADYGWLMSADGTQSTWVLFKAGKQREGYFTNADILNHTRTAMAVLDKDYKDEDHVLVFNNTTTHLKQEEDALSATKMPKFTPKDGRNWGAEVDELNKDCNPVHSTDGKVLKIQVRMESAKFSDGSPQSLYWPEGHKRAGVFKGMVAILVERGFADAFKLQAQHKDFKCAQNATGCCC